MCIISVKNTFLDISCDRQDNSNDNNIEESDKRHARDKKVSPTRSKNHSVPPSAHSNQPLRDSTNRVWASPPFECLRDDCYCKSRSQFGSSLREHRRRSSTFKTELAHVRREPVKMPRLVVDSKLEILGRGLRRVVNDYGSVTIFWEVPALKLTSTDKHVASPFFTVTHDEQETPFKLMLFPLASSDLRRGSCFKTSNFKGYMQLKCDGAAKANNESCVLDFSFFVHSEAEKKGPVQNDFFELTMCGLPQNMSIWDLETSKQHLIVGVTISTVSNSGSM